MTKSPMTDQDWQEIRFALQDAIDRMITARDQRADVDSRAISIAITHAQTALLWLLQSRQDLITPTESTDPDEPMNRKQVSGR